MTQVIVKSCMCTYASDRSPILLLLDWLTLLVAFCMKGTSHAATSYVKAAAVTHADAAAPAAVAIADVAVPYLVVSADVGRYAFPGVGVSGGSVHGILKFCEDFVFFFKFVKNLAYISLMSGIHRNNL